MEKLNICIPQWQGSGITNELYHGTYALKNYVEKKFNNRFLEIDVDDSILPEIKNNILGYDLINSQLLKLHRVLEEYQPEKIFTIGGGCGVEIPVVSFLNEIHTELSLFWFDAHGDLNSPESSVSKHFHGMPLRFLCDPAVTLEELRISKVSPANISLIGIRDLDKPEKDYINHNSITVFSVEDIQSNKFSLSRFREGNNNAYIHIDLDVLDPAHYRNVKCPIKKGLRVEKLYETIEIINENFNVIGLSLVENTELNEREMAKLDKIINYFK